MKSGFLWVAQRGRKTPPEKTFPKEEGRASIKSRKDRVYSKKRRKKRPKMGKAAVKSREGEAEEAVTTDTEALPLGGRNKKRGKPPPPSQPTAGAVVWEPTEGESMS